MTSIDDNVETRPFPANGTLFTWFRQSALRHPGAPAIEVDGHALSYAELLELAERVAARLVDTLGRPPRAIGLLATRSLAGYAGYLAALRLGVTVVPLSPDFPAGRSTLVCRSAGVDVVVADDAGATVARALPAAAVHLTPGWTDTLPDPWSEPYAGTADDVAYVLFTSGSTGTPKGVAIRHRNLSGFLPYSVARHQVGPGARLSQAFELTFDPSVYDMFVTWCAGATLVVPQAGDILAPVRFVNDNGITHWSSVPSVVSLARRLRALRPGCMPDLRFSSFCGEQLTLGQARSWADAAPNSVIDNLYGPTELTVTCVGYRLPADRADWPDTSNDTVPIGRVYPHLDGVVLSPSSEETTDGELCVRGSQRFDGYVDPADDAERFLHHPSYSPDRWYRTGDRVRLEDGELVHLGRLDDQTKVRGYRIELGEIESVLRRHPGVHDVVVLALPDHNDEIGLYALYTGDDVDDAELARLVGSRLPAYMAPRRCLPVDRFPLNPNGKIDKVRLAADTRLTRGR